MKLLKRRPFFYDSLKGAEQIKRLPTKNRRFVRPSIVFRFLIGIAKGDGMPSKHPPQLRPWAPT